MTFAAHLHLKLYLESIQGLERDDLAPQRSLHGSRLAYLALSDPNLSYSVKSKQVRREIAKWKRNSSSEQAKQFWVPGMVALLRQKQGDITGALQSARLLKKWAIAKHNDPALATALKREGAALVQLGRVSEAIQPLEKAHYLFKWKLNELSGQGQVESFLAAAHRIVGSMFAAKAVGLDAINSCIEAKAQSSLIGACQNLASVHLDLGENEHAMEYFQAAYRLAKLEKSEFQISNACLGLAFASLRMGNLDAAESWLEQCDVDTFPRLLGLWGEYSGDLASLKGDSEARVVDSYRQGISPAQISRQWTNVREGYVRIALHFLENGDYVRTKKYLRVAYKYEDYELDNEDTLILNRIGYELKWWQDQNKEAIELLTKHFEEVGRAGFKYEQFRTAQRMEVIAQDMGNEQLAYTWRQKANHFAEVCSAEKLLDILRQREDKRRQEAKDQKLKQVDLYAHGIVTRSKALHANASLISRIGNTAIPVLIRGASGTGKELFAKLTHDLSDRKNQPFVTINCAAIPADIVESEFFGHRRGSFTGAIEDKVGLFKQAHRGTLFLDEVGEMPLPMQAKLLRVLESGEVRQVGSLETERVDVRIVAATNVDLMEAVNQKTFRIDLYYRLRGAEIYLPSLAQRLEDIAPLTRHFMDLACSRMNKMLDLPQATIQWLLGRDWRGNVRQLKAAVDQAVAVCEDGKELTPAEFFGIPKDETAASNFDQEMDSIVEAKIISALEAANWNRSQAARILGMSRTTLNGKIQRMGITKPKTR